MNAFKSKYHLETNLVYCEKHVPALHKIGTFVLFAFKNQSLQYQFKAPRQKCKNKLKIDSSDNYFQFISGRICTKKRNGKA